MRGCRPSEQRDGSLVRRFRHLQYGVFIAVQLSRLPAHHARGRNPVVQTLLTGCAVAQAVRVRSVVEIGAIGKGLSPSTSVFPSVSSHHDLYTGNNDAPLE